MSVARIDGGTRTEGWSRGCLVFSIVSSVVIIGILWPTLRVGADSPKVDWEKLNRLWKDYIAYPSSLNASRVYDLLPRERHVEYTSAPVELSTLEFIDRTLRVLQRQIVSKDRQAVKLAFRLFTITDGSLSEGLAEDLGMLIRIDPRMFLEELAAHRMYVPLGSLVGDFGPDYVDNSNAQELEASLRIKALKSVHEQRLSKLRDECIESLEHQFGPR